MSQPTAILIGPDESGALAKAAHSLGAKLSAVDDISKALDILCKSKVDIAFAHMDAGLPDLFTGLNDNKINLPVVAIGPAKPTQNAVKAVRLGAIDYLSTPVEEPLVASLLEKFKPAAEGSGPIAADPVTLELIGQAKQFAASDATVLLRGESGTGKEVYSRLIHENSNRKDGPFISVNCAAIPESLLESELFGHKKGAFSGAVNDRKGKFEQADGGTLLLDEISEMDLALQAKLLRAIQERVIDPVGATNPTNVDIRLIATTNRQLEDYVAEGKFREDLYFRLNVVALDIPPLRDRPGDIAALSEHFAALYGKQNGREDITISADAMEKLQSCYWKGNVRELENTLHRAVLMATSSDAIEPAHIIISPMSLREMEKRGDAPQQVVAAANVNAAASEEVGQAASQSSAQSAAANVYAAAAGGNFSAQSSVPQDATIGRSLSDVEKDLILNTLDYCKGNRTHAAGILGISIKMLRKKLESYEEAV